MAVGTFNLPLGKEPDESPWSRGYFAGPSTGESTDVSFPLEDIREQVFGKDGGAAFLTKYGFTAIHAPTQVQQKADFDNPDVLEDVYFPEIRAIVQRLTGAKEVIVVSGATRKSKPAATTTDAASAAPPPEAKDKNPIGLVTRSGVQLGPSWKAVPVVRSPHLDYSPLGARQVIRSWRADVAAAATQRGVIAAEDALCAAHGTRATELGSKPVVAAHYAGPRYAAYSFWRPLVGVGRDPLAFLPQERMAEGAAGAPLEISNYEVKVPGHEEMGGDFLREVGALKANTLEGLEEAAGRLRWSYVKNQTPDEALLIKLFDSAALGPEAVEAAAPLHGSPDLGEEGQGPARESIEIRVVAFW